MAWDDALTVGTEGKKRDVKPDMGESKGSTSPDITNYRISIDPIKAATGGAIKHTHREREYQVKLPAGVTDGQNLRVTLDNGDIVCLEIYINYTDGKEIEPLPSWLSAMKVPSQGLKKWYRSPWKTLLFLILVPPCLLLIFPPLGAAGYLIGLGGFLYSIFWAPHTYDAVSVTKANNSCVARCCMPDGKSSGNHLAIAVNGKWVRCIENGHYYNLPVENGSTIVLAEIREDDKKNKTVNWVGQAKS